ncbi:ABC transporter permease [Tistrella bauzanensis]|uniref:ABC transporter permease n=2 Tax=Tistrella bauzanensis TaxID=657419 RepID=A0ABQ1IL85_9PROT|nr:ABC transporter permease [Tistrella bauzanensis]
MRLTARRPFRHPPALRHLLPASLMLLPAVVLLGAFTHLPAVQTVISALYTTPKANRPARFIGLDHYRFLLDDPVFLKAAWNNLIFAAATVPATILISLGMAMLVSSKIRGRGLARLAFFTPTVLPMIAIGNIWLFFYTPGYGLLDQITGLFGFGATNWLGSQETALGAIIVVAIWKEAGFFMIFYLAALTQIPPQLIEAATLEGAGPWARFRRVIWPLVAPTTLFVLVNAIINACRMVDHVIVMTRGGPDNATTLLLLYVYETGFRFWDTGYAAAISVVLLVILALAGIGQFILLDRKVHYR